MLSRILLAIGVGIVTAIVVMVVAAVLAVTGIDILVAIGSILNKFAVLIGIAAGIWWYVTGRTL